jgi:carbamate kinase
MRSSQTASAKDLTAALLARAVDADALLLLTDVDAVTDGFGTPDARPIRHATPARSAPSCLCSWGLDRRDVATRRS